MLTQMPHTLTETQDQDSLIISEARKVVIALGQMFAPICEVVLHDLRDPEHTIAHIENPLSGRKVGDPGTEITWARIKDPNFPDILQNYPNTLPDGRQVKSTSVGIRNSHGKFIAAICLNLDISVLSTFGRTLEHLISTSKLQAPTREVLRARSLRDVRVTIEQFAAENHTQPTSLAPRQRRELVHQLSELGLLGLRGATPLVAKLLGMTRTSIYNDLKRARAENGNPVF